MKYSLIWSFSPGCDQSIERLCYWRLEWQNTDVQVNTLSMNSEAGHFWHSSCHHKPTKSWHSVVQYLYQDTSATSCKKYQNRKKRNASANHTKSNDREHVVTAGRLHVGAFPRSCVYRILYTDDLLRWNSWERKHSKPFLSSHEGNHWVITAVFVYRTTYILANYTHLATSKVRRNFFFSHSEILLDHSMHYSTC